MSDVGITEKIPWQRFSRHITILQLCTFGCLLEMDMNWPALGITDS